MGNSTKLIFIVAILLIIYGYVCRLLDFYVFWVRMGVAIIVVAFAAVARPNIIIRKSAGYKRTIENIRISSEIKSEIGEVRSFGLFLSGLSINTIINSFSSGPLNSLSPSEAVTASKM